ncbi:hypothetical protein B7494_g34 [Chlorociboria aeruginascens]|nr:hypothetical protein B7494_g34 [Chlorociboria aeruginascens]
MVRVVLLQSAPTKPHPQTQDDPASDANSITLLFKHGRYTILLLTSANTPFSRLKTELLSILQERYPSGLTSRSPAGEPRVSALPAEISEIVLGVLVDPYEKEKGWRELPDPAGGIRECPRSLGVKDGARTSIYISASLIGKHSQQQFYTIGKTKPRRYFSTSLQTTLRPSSISRHLRLPPAIMTGPPTLQKQYMSSAPPSTPAPARPSASILLISPSNAILLLHRVQSSSAFPAAHVFPGGNLAPQDGEVPAPGKAGRHVDGPAYRMGAIRECFEESGILLARRRDGDGGLLEVGDLERERARKSVHANAEDFGQWVQRMGGVVDIENLHPFTRWITPANLPKRFSTQMYLYFLPLRLPPTTTTPGLAAQAVIPNPTSDGGLEHTTAQFAPCAQWLARAERNEIILFPPQYYLMSILAPFFLPHPASPSSDSSHDELQRQRRTVLGFLGAGGGENGIKWADKVMSPVGLMVTGDGRSVLGLDKPGPELAGSGRGGDSERVVLVRFGKGGA